MKSKGALLLVSLVWLYLGFSYFPKWEKTGYEATISWDVSGYYHYLPAIFIYKDLRQQNWMDEINKKYLPSPAYDQAFGHHDSGNKVNKYPIGQAVLFSPFFFMAHVYANLLDTFPSDGYSKPYQFFIWLGGFLVSILGLFLLRKILLDFFEDGVVAATIIALGIGTHWAEYAAISNGMNHTWLFTLLCLLILSTQRFYKVADWTSVVGIGASIGLAVLTRPTEITWILIPLLWGMTSIRERFALLSGHWKKCAFAIAIAGAILFIQPLYWKYASGEWLVYTYGEQRFDFLHPRIWRGLFGTNIGWWLYTPVMLLAMFGWYSMYTNQRRIFWSLVLTSLLAIYITFSWSHFESGGGLGQRNLIQIYPLMAFPLAAVIAWFHNTLIRKGLWTILLLCIIYYNGWWLYQAHTGGFFQAGQMNTAYFYRVAGRMYPDRDLFKLLDNKEYFKGQPKESKVLLENDFENDTSWCSSPWPKGGKSVCLTEEYQYYGPVYLPVPQDCNSWIRLEADFFVQTREWDYWKYAQWIVLFRQGDKVIKTNMIRLQRLLPQDQVVKHLFFDVQIPDQPYDQCVMSIWHSNSSQTLLIDNLKVSCFTENP